MDNTTPQESWPRRRLRRLSRRLMIAHRRTQLAAGARGVGLLLTAFLGVDALVVGQGCQWPSNDASLVGTIAGLPCAVARGCRLYHWNDTLLAQRLPSGGWVVGVPQSEADFLRIRELEYERPATPNAALVLVRRPSEQNMGIWSPTLCRRTGRSIQVAPLDASLTPADADAARDAALAAWPQLVQAQTVRYAASPLKPFELNAIKQNRVGGESGLNLGWLINDALVVGTLWLLFIGAPVRRERRRLAAAMREPSPLTRCPCCGYELAGLPRSDRGERRCPECGVLCGEFFATPNPTHAGASE